MNDALPLPHKATVSRLVNNSWIVQFDFDCFIQPIDETSRTFSSTQLSKSFKLFCKLETNIKEGDRLSWGGRNYRLQGIESKDYGGDDEVPNHMAGVLTLEHG